LFNPQLPGLGLLAIARRTPRRNPNPDGSYTITNIINWSQRRNTNGTPVGIGNFQTLLGGPADDPIPGVPGTGLTTLGNISAEIFAYLDLPVGYQKFAINGDDGFRVQVGTQGQTNGSILFTVDRTGGATDFPFAFIIPEAGLYPIRLVWYQGTGDGNLEFFTYGPNNTKIPVNDRTNPNAVKAYYKVISAPQLQFTSVTVSGGQVHLNVTEASVLTGNASDWSPVQPGISGTTTIDRPAVTSGNRFYRLTQ